jgi:hypothetical protein
MCLCVWVWGGLLRQFFLCLLYGTVLWYIQTVGLICASSISIRKELNISFRPFDRHPEENLGSTNAKKMPALAAGVSSSLTTEA